MRGTSRAADHDRDRAAAGELLERAAIDVGDQVAEPIDAHHLAAQLRAVDRRPRQIDRCGSS